MKLTKLEIKGFKSFCDKVTINFDDGVTAIAGPNGCGKSNIVDAIRWVLGEQSTRALRSEKMENVIFNGSRSRKASSLAEVSLNFDNTKKVLPSDYTDLTISRKLYRSGESEYRLNDIQCRLKDITDLFLDTGIGSDSYSIIELRMVEEIISNKEGSRRTLFEEAAGISKYKMRKKQTFSKLKDTEEDLTRVDDLLFEIEKNLKTLESQARRTQRYYALKEEYRESSLLLAAQRISGFRDRTSALALSKQALSDEKHAHVAVTDTLEAALEKIKLESVHKEKNLIVQQKTVHDFASQILEYENQKKVKNEQIKNLQNWKVRLEREKQETQIRLAENGTQIKLLLEKKVPEAILLDEIREQLPGLEEQVAQTRSMLSQQKSTINTKQTKINAQAALLVDNEKLNDRQHIQSETLKTELGRNDADRSLRETELATMNASLQTLEESIATKMLVLTEVTDREEVLKEEITGAEEEQNTLKDLLNKLNRSLDARQNEYKLIKSLVDNLEGFPESIRFLKKNAAWLKNTPLLSDIIFCAEKYRVPIENFLEPYMNYYVADTREDALKAIQLLGNAEKGRANLFFLEAFTCPTPDSGPTPSGCIPALEVLEVEAQYEGLVKYLFKDVYLKLTDTADNQGSDLQQGTLIDSLGRYISSSVHLSGGSVGLFEGKRIGRAKNLEVLQREIIDLERQITVTRTDQELIAESLQQKKSEAGKLNSRQLREEISTINSSRAGVEARKEQFEVFIKSNFERKEDLAAKLAEIAVQQQDLLPLISQLKEEQYASGLELSAIEQEFQQSTEILSEVLQLFNTRNIVFHQQQNKLSGIEKELEYKEINQEQLDEKQEKNTVELAEALTKLNTLLQSTDNKDTDLIELYQQKTALDKGLREIEEDYFKSKGDISALEQQILENRRKRENNEALIQALNEKLTELNMEMHGLKERLAVEFSIDTDNLPEPAEGQEIATEQQTEELKRRNEKVKAQIDSFGAINPLAMEAYTEMDERFQFINGQKDDLLKARKSLLETIQEIDDTARVKFLESFNKIRENFILVFRSLFNEEDSCDLILSDAANPLESDIDILAMPKGKKPLTINQLSGGEKTLTATAILFSLYLLKPAPFCIFDEVDAPLDDSNIDKFNSIIRKFSDQSQFIVVSHNKRTIASTDVIYGITMVEPGVSRIVPVDLRTVETAD